MAASTMISVAGHEVQIRELTAKEIRDLLKSAELDAASKTAELDVVDYLFDDMSLRDICAMTDIKRDAFEEMTPTQIRQIADKCKEYNAHFFSMLERLTPALQQLAEKASPAA